jgi:hypothetical protein
VSSPAKNVVPSSDSPVVAMAPAIAAPADVRGRQRRFPASSANAVHVPAPASAPASALYSRLIGTSSMVQNSVSPTAASVSGMSDHARNAF